MRLSDQLRGLELADLHALLGVVEAGGFRAAARVLHVSQPVLSRRVRRVEAHVGAALLERDPGGLGLTRDGERVLPVVRRILSDLVDLAAAPHQVRLGVPFSVAGYLLAPFLSAWRARHPDVQLTAVEDGVVALRDVLAERRCDLAFLARPIPDFAEARTVRTVSVVAYLPRDHPGAAAGAEPLAVAALHDEPVLTNGPPFANHALFEAACTLAGVAPQVVYRSANAETLAALAAAGLGVAVTGDLLDAASFDVVPRRLTGPSGHPLTFDLCVAWDARRTLPDVCRRFVDELVEHQRASTR